MTPTFTTTTRVTMTPRLAALSARIPLFPIPPTCKALTGTPIASITPLRYTDPSGHDEQVEGNNVNGVNNDNIEEYFFAYQAMGINLDIVLLVATAVFNSFAPGIAQTLQQSEMIFNVTWGTPTANGSPAQTIADPDTKGKYNVTLKKEYFDTVSAIELSSYAVHELGVHCLATVLRNGPDDTTWEEGLAYRFQCQYLKSVGYTSNHKTNLDAVYDLGQLCSSIDFLNRNLSTNDIRKPFNDSIFWGNPQALQYLSMMPFPDYALRVNIILNMSLHTFQIVK
jgi:hypothetical protein